MRILYIDDKPDIRNLLQRYLTSWGYEAVGASDGEEGWQLIQSLHPDIVITDWMMPGLNGLELCNRIRTSDIPTYIYVILLTARNIKEDLIVGMEAGADDFIGKPFEKLELKARLKAAARIISLERTLEEKNSKLEEAYNVIKDDLEAAARIQHSLIPQKIEHFGGITFDWLFCPSLFVAGDIFNIVRLDEKTLAFYLLDVSGHGIPAALLSTTLSRVLTPTPNFAGPMRHSLAVPPFYRITAPREVVSELNGRFMNDDVQTQYFTIVYGIIDIHSAAGTLTQAGHPSPIHQSADGTVRLIGDGGFPVGMFPEADYEEHPFSINVGERLFLYSDGITECRGNDGRMFGIDRLLKIICDGYRMSLRNLMISIERELAVFQGSSQFDDDISLLVMERKEE
ncbi:MAG: SpoIIE family protein phosphatase [Desulfuromonadales bacterium]